MDLLESKSTGDEVPTWRSLGALGLFGASVASAAAVGARANAQPTRWYRRLRKSPLNPPAWVFGPVWTSLYASIALSGWRVWRYTDGRARRRLLGLWASQLALNAAWSPLFFGKRRPRVALLDLAALLVAIGAYTRSAARSDRGAAWLMAPYLGWVGFAAYLNGAIVHRNPGLRG